MSFMLVRHRVKSFAAWKAAFYAHAGVRRGIGSRGGQVLQNTDDPNEVVILLEVDDVARARAFAGSEDLRQTMQRAGVTDQPDIFFLYEAGRPVA